MVRALQSLIWLPMAAIFVTYVIRSARADNLNFDCDYGSEFSDKMHLEKDVLLDHLNKVIARTDVDILSNRLKTLARKTDEDYLKEVVSSLPSMDTIANFKENAQNEEHSKTIQKAYQSLFSNIMEQVSNSSASLQYDLDKIKEEVSSLSQNNVTKIMEKVNALSTNESIENLSIGLKNAETTVIEMSKILQDSLAEGNQNFSNFLTQGDINSLSTTLSVIISQQDIGSIYSDMNHISTKESIDELFEKLSHLPRKEELESMGIFIESTPSIEKNDIQKITDQIQDFASKEAVKHLENSITTLDMEMDAYMDELNDIIAIASLLLEDMEAQEELINNLVLHFNKQGSSESLIDLKEILMATYLTINETFEYINDQDIESPSDSLEVMNSVNECIQPDEAEESMKELQDKIVLECNTIKLQDFLFSYESKILNNIDNISLTEAPKKDSQDLPIAKSSTRDKRVLERPSPCEDSEFVGAPGDLDICSVIVARNLCSADPLMSYHCCRSCLRAHQIQEMGKHRYLQVPRRINYNALIWNMTLNRN